MFGELAQQHNITIEYRFYPSHHGKSLCDAHTGVAKQFINRKVISRQVSITDIPTLANELASMKNTKVIQLPNIVRFENFEVNAIPNIRKCHKFCYRSNSDGSLMILAHEHYDDDPVEISVVLRANSGEELQPNECLFCKSKGKPYQNHNHRVCKLFYKECKQDEVKETDFEFLSTDGNYHPTYEDEVDDDEVEEEADEIGYGTDVSENTDCVYTDDEIEDSDSGDDYEPSDEDEQPFRKKQTTLDRYLNK